MSDEEIDFIHVQQTDALVYEMHERGASKEAIILAMAGRHKDLVAKVIELTSIAPRAVRLPDGAVKIWRCPDHLVPVTLDATGEGAK